MRHPVEECVRIRVSKKSSKIMFVFQLVRCFS